MAGNVRTETVSFNIYLKWMCW